MGTQNSASCAPGDRDGDGLSEGTRHHSWSAVTEKGCPSEGGCTVPQPLQGHTGAPLHSGSETNLADSHALLGQGLHKVGSEVGPVR